MINNALNKKRRIILGTDWWTDCDDIAALRIACRADKLGMWELSAVVLNACMEYSAASLDGFMIHEGYSHVPLGIDLDAVDFGRNPPYQKVLSEVLPHKVNKNEELINGKELYLRTLRESDEPVDILEIGYPQVLAALCRDDEGYVLMRDKVRCLWMMAGNWENNGVGKENNIARAQRSRTAAEYLLEHCPCPIVFLGWEVGASVISGKPCDIADENDPLRVAFRAHGSQNGRSSWDPMLVLLALDDDYEKSGYTVRRGKASADAKTGENRFEYDDNGPHCYVVKSMPDAWYEDRLSMWLCDDWMNSIK